MTFLPENYHAITASRGSYLKFKDGTTKFRVLSEQAVTGFIYWTNLNKPVRLKEQPETEPENIRIDDKTGKPEKIKHFWVMTVFDYASEQPCILEITQASIQRAIHALFQDADWGHPSAYDIKVTRSGSGIDTKYQVAPVPHKPFDYALATGWEEIDLEALFVAGDPFSNSSNGNGLKGEIDCKSLGFASAAQFEKAWERFEGINSDAVRLGMDLHPDPAVTTLQQLTELAKEMRAGIEDAQMEALF